MLLISWDAHRLAFYLTVSQKDPCYELRRSSTMVRRIHMCFYCHDVTEVDNGHDITLTTHTLFNRLDKLTSTIGSYEGPVSVALYVTDEEAQIISEKLGRGELPNTPNIRYHVIYQRGVGTCSF